MLSVAIRKKKEARQLSSGSAVAAVVVVWAIVKSVDPIKFLILFCADLTDLSDVLMHFHFSLLSVKFTIYPRSSRGQFRSRPRALSRRTARSVPQKMDTRPYVRNSEYC